ncbi:SDR family oxidoreductase [Mangrovimicrobium sediminis]|uniref:SDR family oxidoreductase n=1 Tax=Mangrovimicrobium sediminis TaxID=2562682 RepID=UPI001F0D1AA3|nr:SDR family oxidoreductase [Haliea sp. SAOS-164]
MNILITGASVGLGRGMAREFAAAGHSLALCARRVDALQALRDELLAAAPGIRVSVRALDVNCHEDVFSVFRDFAAEFGTLDRIVVNAGVGKGQPLGTGYFHANLATAQTNFVAALAQCEAAMELFRAQGSGHLVTISSMSALRGMPRNMTAYGATKAGLASLSEGLRLELLGTPIRVTTVYPGYIRTEINDFAGKLPFEVDEATGSRAIVRAIESGRDEVYVPAWPWRWIGMLMRVAPLWLLRRMI